MSGPLAVDAVEGGVSLTVRDGTGSYTMVLSQADAVSLAAAIASAADAFPSASGLIVQGAG